MSMELIFKSAAAALLAALTGLLIRRTNPEMSLVIGACTVTVIAAAALSFAGELATLTQTVKTLVGTSDTFIAPILKCTAIAVVTKLTSELCRDSSQAATAAAIELAGTMFAMSISMPLIIGMLRMIGGMV